MATSMENFSRHLANSKSLLQELHEKNLQHPSKDNEIYATIKVPEIIQGLTPEDFRKIDK
jgi:hypothetical protein